MQLTSVSCSIPHANLLIFLRCTLLRDSLQYVFSALLAHLSSNFRSLITFFRGHRPVQRPHFNRLLSNQRYVGPTSTRQPHSFPMPSIIHSGGVVSLLCLYLLAVLLALLPAPANAALVNVTVDDNSLSPTAITYLPPDTWSFGPTCPTCDAHPDANRAFKGTWHDTSFFPATESGAGQAQTASLVFDGALLQFGIRVEFD